MPLWIIYHPPGTFEDDASKQALAEDLTTIYTAVGLPAFYVIINFIPLPVNNVYVGGKQRTERPYIRLVGEHIAVHLEDDAAYHRTTAAIEAKLKPHIADKGYDWELHVDETPRGLWRIQGLIPPPFKSEAEKLWAKVDKPVPYESEGKL